MTRRRNIHVVSFSYRRGIPRKADAIFDVRFLPNPHYVDSLRPFSGRVPRVARFILRKRETREFLKFLRPLLRLMLKKYPERTPPVRLAFGCTGGKHRSVCVAEALAKDLNRWGYAAKVRHRDLTRER